jgi:single-stranded-DNA-specific exonuclease
LGDGGYAGLPAPVELEQLEPFGEANPEPLFLLEQARVDDARSVGEGHLKLRLALGNDALPAFGYALAERKPEKGATLRAVGHLRLDTWGGRNGLELRLLDFETL